MLAGTLVNSISASLVFSPSANLLSQAPVANIQK